MGNVIWTVSSTGLDYWAAHVGGEKIKTDRLKLHTGSDDLTLSMTYLSYANYLVEVVEQCVINCHELNFSNPNLEVASNAYLYLNRLLSFSIQVKVAFLHEDNQGPALSNINSY